MQSETGEERGSIMRQVAARIGWWSGKKKPLLQQSETNVSSKQEGSSLMRILAE